MDGITQAVLGAAVAHGACGHKLPRRVAWWGALGGIVPDLDILAAAPFDAFTSMWMHRGTSHSLWFGWVVGPALGWLVWRYYRWRDSPVASGPHSPPETALRPGDPAALRWWMLAFALAIFTHPLLDVFTSYGTQLLAPFSRRRFIIDGVGIIDPFYTFTLAGALLVGRLNRARPERALRVVRWSLAVTTSYILLGAGLTLRAESFAKAQLSEEGTPPTRIDAYTQVLNIGLKRVVAHQGDQTFVGYVSGWNPSKIYWWSFENRSSPLVDEVAASKRGKLFTWFADQQIASHVQRHPDGRATVSIDDIRYGFPGKPKQGFWGIRAEVDSAGNIVDVQRMGRRREMAEHAYSDLLRAAFGHDPRTFMVGIGGGHERRAQLLRSHVPALASQWDSSGGHAGDARDCRRNRSCNSSSSGQPLVPRASETH